MEIANEIKSDSEPKRLGANKALPVITPKIRFISAIDGKPVEPSYLPLDSYVKFKEDIDGAKGGSRAVAQAATEAAMNHIEGQAANFDLQKDNSSVARKQNTTGQKQVKESWTPAHPFKPAYHDVLKE
jgi:hypothetical protein